jgi:hypothetical protein
MLKERKQDARVAAGARIASGTEEYIVFAHGPCAKFRVVIPLLQP